MKNFKLVTVVLLSMFILTACSEGPAEKKGKEIDNAVQDIKDKVQDKGPVQKLGEKVDDSTGN